MTDTKPQVVYFSGAEEMLDRVTSVLSRQFEVTGVSGVTRLDDVLSTLRQIKPDYVLIDPHLPDISHRQLHRLTKGDEELKGIQLLVIRDDVSDH